MMNYVENLMEDAPDAWLFKKFRNKQAKGLVVIVLGVVNSNVIFKVMTDVGHRQIPVERFRKNYEPLPEDK